MKKIVSIFFAIFFISLLFNSDLFAASAAAKAGKKLYNANCKSCHGTKGVGGTGPNIKGTTVSLIKSNGMSKGLSNANLKKIVAYLKNPFKAVMK